MHDPPPPTRRPPPRPARASRRPPRIRRCPILPVRASRRPPRIRRCPILPVRASRRPPRIRRWPTLVVYEAVYSTSADLLLIRIGNCLIWSPVFGYMLVCVGRELAGLACPEAGRGRGGSFRCLLDVRDAGNRRQRFIGRAR